MKPNRYEAKKLAEYVTDYDIDTMLVNARYNITNWKERSSINKGLTKGAVYNILKDVTANSHKVAITNAIQEFGEYLPQAILNTIKRKNIKSYPEPYHENPIFDNDNI